MQPIFQLRSPKLCKILCILLVEYVEPGKNRSDVPSSRKAFDITIEQTINRHAKSHSRIVGFSRYRSAYYRWWRTRHAGASYLQATKKKQNLKKKKFANQAKTSLVQGKLRKNIEITAERNVLGQLVILKLQHELSLESVLGALSKSQNWPAGTMSRPDILAMK